MPVVIVTVSLAAAGALAGAGARVLLGRLRRGAQVPPPWCELALALLWAATGGAWAAGMLPAGWLPALLGLGWLAVAAGAVDLRRRRVPDALTLPALPVALLLLLPVGPSAAARGAGGAVLAVAVHAAVHLADRRAVGAGDVKLAAPLGAVLAAAAWPALALAAVLAAVFTVFTAAVSAAAPFTATAAVSTAPAPAAATTGKARASPRLPRRAVPHGPSMLAAAWIVTAGLVAVGAAGGGGGG